MDCDGSFTVPGSLKLASDRSYGYGAKARGVCSEEMLVLNLVERL